MERSEFYGREKGWLSYYLSDDEDSNTEKREWEENNRMRRHRPCLKLWVWEEVNPLTHSFIHLANIYPNTVPLLIKTPQCLSFIQHISINLYKFV